ncbi:MAG TPA: hypothetical protein DEA49_05150 [Petrotoga sp.]|nr:hypothetical protein [Petrotoga sp.]
MEKGGNVFKLRNPSVGTVEYEDLINFIKLFLENKSYKVWVGTDSHARDGHVTFATAIVIYKVGNGATYFYYVTHERRSYDMYSRLIKEAEFSLNTAEFIENNLNLVKPEIHLDIGLNGRSKEVLNVITGYVKGLGYNYKIKPESFAATNVAHLYTK